MLEARVESALGGTGPTTALETLVVALYAEGLDEAEVYGLLLDAQKRRRRWEAEGRSTPEAEEDTIVDVPDRVVGWCPPSTLLQRGS